MGFHGSKIRGMARVMVRVILIVLVLFLIIKNLVFLDDVFFVVYINTHKNK